MKITINVKVLPDENCIVRNYCCRPAQWENGIVRDTEVGIRADGTYHVSYRVLLDRRTTGRSRMFPEGGAPIFVTGGDDGIVTKV